MDTRKNQQQNIPKHLVRLFSLIKEKETIDCQNTWCKGSTTYFEELQKEIVEVCEELEKNRMVYLEDELGDVLWDYLNLLSHFEKEGKISHERVFERCVKKYTQRLNGVRSGTSWEDIKTKQKKSLKKEHNSTLKK